MESEIAFNWPEPGEDFWLATGAQLGLDESASKFAAALHALGGADAKKNTQAARVAGLTLDRTQAFRLARSVAVRKLLDEANKIKSGKRPPVSEAEVDARIDDLIRAPDALTVARGIELREKRKAAERANNAQPEETLEQNLAALICSVPESGVGAFLSLAAFHSNAGNLVNHPFLRQTAPLVAKFYPKEWAEWRSKHRDGWQSFLDEVAKGPLLEGDELDRAVRAKVPTMERVVGAENAD